MALFNLFFLLKFPIASLISYSNSIVFLFLFISFFFFLFDDFSVVAQALKWTLYLMNVVCILVLAFLFCYFVHCPCVCLYMNEKN